MLKSFATNVFGWRVRFVKFASSDPWLGSSVEPLLSQNTRFLSFYVRVCSLTVRHTGCYLAKIYLVAFDFEKLSTRFHFTHCLNKHKKFTWIDPRLPKIRQRLNMGDGIWCQLTVVATDYKECWTRRPTNSGIFSAFQITEETLKCRNSN